MHRVLNIMIFLDFVMYCLCNICKHWISKQISPKNNGPFVVKIVYCIKANAFLLWKLLLKEESVKNFIKYSSVQALKQYGLKWEVSFDKNEVDFWQKKVWRYQILGCLLDLDLSIFIDYFWHLTLFFTKGWHKKGTLMIKSGNY